MTDDAGVVHVGADEARAFVAAILMAEEVPADDAAVVAGCLVRADLRGVDTHGIVRVPGYVDRLRRCLINPAPRLRPERVTPVAARLDGENGFGFVVATRSMAESIDMARSHGLGVTSVRRSTHFGMAACYLLQALDAGLAAFVFTNASPALPPWGGRAPLLGTSPFAVAIPGGRLGPFVLDMSPTVAARGRIRRALARGESIPEGWALDVEGWPTTDPAAALEGVLLPIGGPKGSGLSMLMDILGGVLSGAAYGGDVGNQYLDYSRPQDVGHFMLALRPDLFLPGEEVAARMDRLIERIRACPKADGVGEILIPGEPEARQERARLAAGIPYRRADLAPLLELAATRGVPPPATSPPAG